MAEYNELMFEKAEKAATDWFLGQFDHELFKQGQPGEFKGAGYDQWYFAITGPSTADAPLACAVSATAMISGRYRERKEAQRLAGKVRKSLGTELNVTNPADRILNIELGVDGETFIRESDFIPADARDGKARQMWLVEIQLQVVFTTT